jgi:hypothetical protein
VEFLKECEKLQTENSNLRSENSYLNSKNKGISIKHGFLFIKKIRITGRIKSSKSGDRIG